MLEKNLHELEAAGAACAAAIRGAGDDAALEFFASRCGAPSASIRVAGTEPKSLYSRFDPMKQAAREAAIFAAADGEATVAVLGLGLGYHLESLAEKFPRLNFIVFEKRPALAREALRRADWTPLIRSGRLTLHAGLTASEAEQTAAALAEKSAAVSAFRHPALFDAELDYYYPVLRSVRSIDAKKLRVLSFTARGAALPHSLADCHDAFRELGHDVRVIDLSAFTREHEKVDAARSSAVEFAPDLVFTIDVAGLVPHIHGRMGVPVVSWFFDNPLSFLESRSSGREAVVHYMEDMGENYYIFSWDSEYIGELKRRGAPHAEYLPFATNPAVFKPIELTEEDRAEYGCDISFAGNSGGRDPETRRRLTIAAMRGLNVNVYGDDGWLEIAGDGVEYRGRVDNRAGLPALYNASAINLNITDSQSISSLPIRVFDIMACGGFLISDYREDLTRLFTAGKEVVCASSAGDMRKAAEYYLARPDERRAVAEAGRARVLAEHTFKRRVSRILDRVYHGA